VPAFGHLEQGVRRSAFKLDVRLKARQPAGGVEQAAKYEPGIQQKQRKLREALNLDGTAIAHCQPRMRDREQVDQLQRTAGEVPVARLSRVSQSLPEVNLAALQHCQGVVPNRFNQFHFHIGMALRVAVQEIRNDALDELRRGSDLQHAGASAPQLLRPLAKCAGVIQQTTAVAEQLLAFASQHETASHTIEKLETELLLQGADLPRQSRLGNAQAQRCLGDGAELGHGDEGSRVTQVHDVSYAGSASMARGTWYWTAHVVMRHSYGARDDVQENVVKPFGLMLAPAVVLTLTAFEAEAQTWPAKPLKAVVPFAAGSLIDIVPRLVFEQLSTQIGQGIVVENRPGAGGTIGASVVAKAVPDGYTVLVTSSAHTIAPALYPNLSYLPARDFAAVTPLGIAPFVLVVNPDRGFSTVRDLVTAAKAKRGAFNFSSPGVGSASHLSAELFRLSAGVQAVHVPFKGGVEAMTEVIAGRIDFFFMAMGAALPHIRDGKLTALAVNSAKRTAALPEVPTLQEAGFNNAENPTWFGLFLPAGTPREIIDKLHHETLEALQEPKVREKLATLGVDPMVMTSQEFDAYVDKQVAADAALVKAIGLRTQ
jgi:tripartite-type tricarboxylate transporter receptor subunit TctC